jgi:hypothetical protein
MVLFLLFLLAYWVCRLRKRVGCVGWVGSHMDVSSASALDPGEVQLMVAQVPSGFQHLTIFGDVGCEYDVFVEGLSRIPSPILGGTTTLSRLYGLSGQCKDELMVVAKKNVTQQRIIAPSVVRFH